MRTLVVAAVVVVGILGGNRAARAGEGDPPCMKDIGRWCSMMPDMDGYLTTCLQGHWNDISPGCRKTLNKNPDREIEVRHACKSDVDKLCGSSAGSSIPGNPNIVGGATNLECLARNRDKLSAKCRDVLEPKPADGSALAPKPADGVEIITPKGSDLAPIEVQPGASE